MSVLDECSLSLSLSPSPPPLQTSFDRNVLSSLVALRADYKTNKLAKLFA